jgi:hypothetical protein
MNVGGGISSAIGAKESLQISCILLRLRRVLGRREWFLWENINIFSNLFWTTELTFLGLEKVRHVDCRLQSASDDVSPLLGLREVSALKVKKFIPFIFRKFLTRIYRTPR